MSNTLYVHVNNHVNRKSYRKMTGRERKQTQPSYTVAGVLEGDTITFGIAVCSREDSFSKETGRKLALKNLDIKTKVTLSDHVVKNMGIGKYFVAKAKRLIEKG